MPPEERYSSRSLRICSTVYGAALGSKFCEPAFRHAGPSISKVHGRPVQYGLVLGAISASATRALTKVPPRRTPSA